MTWLPARALRRGDGAACELGGRVEGTGGRLVRFGPGFVHPSRYCWTNGDAVNFDLSLIRFRGHLPKA